MLEKELKSVFVFKEEYTQYNGYCIVRFAVNCKDETDRFRLEFLNTDFKKIEIDPNFEFNIHSTVKRLNGWIHPVYKNKDYDGYSFFILKMINGKIVLA